MQNINQTLPSELAKLILMPWWPRTDADVVAQESNPFVSKSVVQELFAGEDIIRFFPAPFFTASEYERNEGMPVPKELDCGLSIDLDSLYILGDFGHGSDAHFAILMSEEYPNAPVIKEVHDFSNGSILSCWKKQFDGFSQFSRAIDL